MRKAFITGVAGFAGSHLAEHLIECGWEVTGVDHQSARLDNLELVAGRMNFEKCDILRSGEIGPLIAARRPEAVFHLAAVAFVPSAESSPGVTFDANVRGCMNVLEECRKHVPEARVVVISSSEVYGKVTPEEVPVKEDREPMPANFYALTKLCAEDVANYYARASSMGTVVLRPFNHIGPRQSPVFVTSSFARQIAEIEAGKKAPVLEVGNLEAARDFTDVRDMVRGYRLGAERCEPGKPYNICSGRSYAISEILEKLLEMSEVTIEVRQDPSRLRKSDIPLMMGDYSRFAGATGWAPRCDIDITLADILDYWRSQVKNA